MYLANKTEFKNVYGWKIEVIDNQDLLTEKITEQLKKHDENIYFNDTTGNYWMFDFKIDGVWFEALDVDCVDNNILFCAYL